MVNKPTTEDFSVFADVCISQLPDSIAQRKTCLECLLASLPKRHPRIHEVATIYAHLAAHERAQQEFKFGTR